MIRKKNFIQKPQLDVLQLRFVFVIRVRLVLFYDVL